MFELRQNVWILYLENVDMIQQQKTAGSLEIANKLNQTWISQHPVSEISSAYLNNNTQV